MAITEKVLFEAPTQELGRPVQNWVDSSLVVSVIGRFENQTANNHWLQARRKGHASRDIGSNWTAFSSGVEVDPFRLNVLCHQVSDIYNGYRGPVLAGHSNYLFDSEDFFNLPLGYTSEPDLIGMGTTAIARVLPTNPVIDLPVAVAELLSEGLPFIPDRERFMRNGVSPSNLAAANLGYEFGLKPFLSDLQDFKRAAQNAERLIQQYVDKSGELIHRRYEFPTLVDDTVDEVTTETGYEKYAGGPCQSQIAGHLQYVLSGYPGEVTTAIHREKKTWFSGAFTYYLPSTVNGDLVSKLRRQESEMARIWGRISPQTAWNLLPYSWAADWFTNAGDVIHNISAFANDGLVMGYGYVMEACNLRITKTLRNCTVGRVRILNDVDLGSNNNSYVLPDVTTTWTAKYLRRRKATPFGFGLDTDGFTNRQKGIALSLVLK